VFNNVPEKKFLKQPHIQDSTKIRLILLMCLATSLFHYYKIGYSSQVESEASTEHTL